MSRKKSNKPAFPPLNNGETSGLSKHEYACIKLGIPETGDEALDNLIRKSERKRIAAMAMQGFIQWGNFGSEEMIRRSLEYTDELLKQLENGK